MRHSKVGVMYFHGIYLSKAQIGGDGFTFFPPGTRFTCACLGYSETNDASCQENPLFAARCRSLAQVHLKALPRALAKQLPLGDKTCGLGPFLEPNPVKAPEILIF